MTDLDEANLVLMRAQGFKDPVHAIAGESEYGVDVPANEPLDQQIRYSFGTIYFEILVRLAGGEVRLWVI